MSSKNNPVDSLKEIADHFDQIKGMNPHLTATQILETISKATGQTLSNVKKRWKLIIGVEWPVIDYLERGVIGMNRAALLVENNMSIEERMQALEQSLDENITDAEFKEWIMRFLEKRAEEQATPA